MRIIGLPWAFSILHLKVKWDVDMNTKIKEFYSLFLHYEKLSDEDINKLFNIR